MKVIATKVSRIVLFSIDESLEVMEIVGSDQSVVNVEARLDDDDVNDAKSGTVVEEFEDKLEYKTLFEESGVVEVVVVVEAGCDVYIVSTGVEETIAKLI